jgi:hypothetical protein
VSRCEHCPVEAGKTCLGDAHPEAFPHFCRWATSDEPREREMVVLRSELGYEAPAPRAEGRPEPAPSYGLPLAGDLAAAFTARVGADRAVKWVAAKLGTEDCGCDRRRQALNALDAKLRRFLGW